MSEREVGIAALRTFVVIWFIAWPIAVFGGHPPVWAKVYMFAAVMACVIALAGAVSDV